MAKTLDAWLVAYRETYSSFGISVTDDQITAGFGNINAALGYGLAERYRHAYAQQVFGRLQELMLTVELYEGALELFEQLRGASRKTGLVTSSRRSVVQPSFARFGLDQFFDAVVTFEDVRLPKPHPEGIETALRILESPKQGAVMIGDSDKDINAARNAGIDSILVFPPEHEIFYDRDRLLSLEPTHVCESLDDVGEILGIGPIKQFPPIGR